MNRSSGLGAESPRLGYVLVASAASLWGLWSLFFRPAERRATVSPALEAFLVFSAIFAVTFPLALRDRPTAPRPLRAWMAILWLGIGDGSNALLFFAAMQKTSLAIAVLSHYLAPVLIAVTAPFVLGERARAGTFIALLVALCGLTLLLGPWAGSSKHALVGAAFGATSALFYAANVLVTKRVQKWFSSRELLAWHVPPALVLLWAFVPAGGFAIGFVPIGLVLIAGVSIGAIGGLLFLSGLVRVDASRASVLTLLEPVVAVLVGAVVWHEVPGVLGAFGAVLVLAAAGWVLRSGSAAGPAPVG